MKKLQINYFVKLSYTMIVVSAVLIWPAFNLQKYNMPFWSNLLQNFLVGLALLGLTLLVGYYTASNLLYQKLIKVAPALADFVEALRVGEKIDEETARKGVIFAVSLISERAIKMAHSVPKTLEEGELCRICNLAHNSKSEESNECKHCQIPRNIWKNPAKTTGH